jgi:hypothetical protein
MRLDEVYPELEYENAGHLSIRQNEVVFSQAMDQLHCNIAVGLVALDGIRCWFEHHFEPYLSGRATNQHWRRAEAVRLEMRPEARLPYAHEERIRQIELGIRDMDVREFEAKRRDREEQLIRELGNDITKGLPRTFNEYLKLGRLKLKDGTVLNQNQARTTVQAIRGLRKYPWLFRQVAGDNPRFDLIENLAWMEALVESDSRERGIEPESLASKASYAEEFRKMVREKNPRQLKNYAQRTIKELPVTQSSNPGTGTENRSASGNPLYRAPNGDVFLHGELLLGATEGISRSDFARVFQTVLGDYGVKGKADQHKAIELLKRPDVTTALRIAIGQLRQGIIDQDTKGE